MTLHPFQVRLIRRAMLTPHILQLIFERTDKLPLPFIPGQFVTFLLPHEGQILRRSYSLAHSPEHPYEIEIAISYIPNGVATYILFNLEVGEELSCVGPQGRLILHDSENPMRYIMVATSTGVSPYRSMLPSFVQRFQMDPF